MKLKSILLLAALVASLPLQAEEAAPAVEKPSFSATQTVKATTVVEAVDREARTVTLKGPQGNTRTLQARKDSNNIDQIEVGDLVNVEFVQNMTIEVFAGDGAEPGAGIMVAEGANEEGENPAVMAVESFVETAVVEEINIEANTFKLRWAEGEVQEYTARDPENLKKAEVGDLVVTTYTEAIALVLEKVTKE